MSWPQPPLDRSIVGWDPLDEISVKVGDWIAEHGRDRENLEVGLTKEQYTFPDAYRLTRKE